MNIKSLKNFLFTLFFLVDCTMLFAQNLGKHDSKINWRTIDSEAVRVIFPEGTDAQAKRIADVINYIHNNATSTVGDKSKHFDLVLQTQQTISNGFVTLSPFRSEFFGVAPQNLLSLGTTDWLDLLAVHEYRHALQYANANRGFTKLMYWIAGQNGWSASQWFSIPSWYLEGDAVLSESLLTEQGRGRNPYFFKEQRALLLDDIRYSYEKAQNGSFKDIVPNIYPLGFTIANHLRNNYGSQKGKEILADAGRYRYGFYPFSSAMKKQTGLTTSKMYKESHKTLQQKWKNEIKNISPTKSVALTEKNEKTVTNYKFPQYLNDGSIVSIKSSFKETPILVHIKNGSEQKIRNLDITAQDYIAVTNDKIAWTVYSKDLRRENKNYNDIVTYDYQSGVSRKITNKKRYFSPHISHDGSRIVAVEYNENTEYRINILDAKSGEVQYSLPNPDNDFLSTPKWNHNNTSCIYLVRRNSKIAFFSYHFETETTKQLSDWTTEGIGQFSLSDTHIYFTASFSGIDNIYRLDLEGNKTLEKITDEKVGAYMPAISSDYKTISYSEFTSQGHQLFELDLSANPPTAYTSKKEDLYNITTSFTERPILDSIPKNKYTTENYKGFFKGIKLHSWGLTTTTNSTNTYGANLQFRNVLNDFSAYISLLHNTNENTNSLQTNINYGKGLVSWNFNSATQERNTINRQNGELANLSFSEVTFGGGVSIPLSQIHGNYSRSFYFKSNYIQHKTSSYVKNDVNPIAGELNFGAIESQLRISNIRRTALQNVAPKFGQFLDIIYYKSVDAIEAEKIAFNSIFYFPGFSKNHSTNLLFNWQQELLTNLYQYADTFSYARGYNSLFNDAAVKISLNYELPLFYPDWGFWGITYFKRVRCNLFYDFSRLSIKREINNVGGIPVMSTFTLDQSSTGIEVMFDNLFFNKLPITVGLRESFLLDTDLQAPEQKEVFQVFFRVPL